MFQRVLIFFQLLLAVIYASAGLSKLFPGVPNLIGPVWLIDELSKYGLGLFGYFIAISQAMAGLILFFPRFRLLGSMLLLPMHLCITVVPISLGWQGTPIVNGVLLLMLLTLLYSERDRLKLLFLETNDVVLTKYKATYWITFAALWSFAAFLRYGHLLR